MNPDEIVMYILVNEDLKKILGTGKTAAQVAHSACKIVSRLEKLLVAEPQRDDVCWYDAWYKGSYVKIVVKAKEYFLTEMMQKYPPIGENKVWTTYTKDEGRTQIPKNSLTTVAFNPAPRSELPKELEELSLLN